MSEDFEQRLLRLKQALQVSEDQEVAVALGMTRAALSDRKRRGAFPEDKLLALATRRPELNLDTHYVLSGERAPLPSSTARGPAELIKRGKFAPPLDHGRLAKCVALVDAELRRRVLVLDDEQRGRVYGGAYDLSLLLPEPTPDLIERVVNLIPPSASTR